MADGGLGCVLGHSPQSGGKCSSWAAAVHRACMAAPAGQLLHPWIMFGTLLHPRRIRASALHL